MIRSEVAWTPDFANLGYLAPLDGTAALKNQDDFLKQAVASTKYDGKTFAVPQVIDSMGVFYNKKMFKEAGVDAPANLDDLKTVAKKIKDKTGKTGLYLRGDDPYYFLSFLYGEGGDMVDASSKTVTIDKPEGVKAFKAVKELVDDGTAKTDASDGWENMMQAFKNGDVAMMVNGPWAVADTLTGKEFTDKDNLGVAPVPSSSAQGAPQGGHNLAVYAGSKNLEASYAFVEYMTSVDSQATAVQRAEPAAHPHLRVRQEGSGRQRDRRLLQAGRRDRRRAPLDPRGRQPLRAAARRVHQGSHRPDHAGEGRQGHR